MTKLTQHVVTYSFPWTDDAGGKGELLSVILKWIEDNVPKDAKDPYVNHTEDGCLIIELSMETAKELFEHTNKQLGLDIEYRFCPHQSAPISCYCRKPQCGVGVEFMIKHKLSRKDTIFVGDMTTDSTFAKRAGIQYMDQADFFK
jgi:hypothetical protein